MNIFKPFSRIFLLCLGLFASLIALAQEQTTTTTTSSKTEFQVEPWMWVVGGAVFILLLVAILKSGNKDKSQ